jgi:hypothetical protein
MTAPNHCPFLNPLNAELNPICHLLALLGGATIVVVGRLRVKQCGHPNLFHSVNTHRVLTAYKYKGKAHPITGHEAPEGEQRCSYTLSLTSALDGVGGQLYAPGALTP